jgi:mannose-6-phosphate isomerase-like protein (cupin superfamily)
MSYPEPRYEGDTGEISALYRPGDAAPELRNPSGGSASYLATGAATNGRFGLYRWDMAARPNGPAPHFHKTISESFFILSGTVRLFDGGTWTDTGPGDFLYVPALPPEHHRVVLRPQRHGAAARRRGVDRRRAG